MPQFLHRVPHGPGTCVVQFEMQVGPRRVSCVAADGYQVAAFYGQLAGRIAKVQRVASTRPPEQFFVGFGKALQVTVDAGQPVGMGDIDGIAKAILIHRDARDVAIGNRENLLALLIIGLDIQSAVKVPRPRLAEIACQHDVVIHR